MTLIEVCMHLIEFNPEHTSFSLFQCLFVFSLSFEDNYYMHWLKWYGKE